MNEKIFSSYEAYEDFYFPDCEAGAVRRDSRMFPAEIMAQKAMEKHGEKLGKLPDPEKSE